jgi:hypothetical protein
MSVLSDIFIITSVINTGSVPWSYTATRSVYTPQERYEQTLQTIKSIRDYSEGSKIVLVECSDLSAGMVHELTRSVDVFLQLYDDETARAACLQTLKKGYGEAVQTAAAIRAIKESGLDFRRIFKISGRYWLKSSFQPTHFSDSTYTFKVPHPGTTSYSTVLYSVPQQLFSDYERVVAECCDTYARTSGPIGYEVLFPPKCNPKQLVPSLQVAGLVAVCQNEYYEG